MTTFRSIPSNATASVLTSFLDRHGKVGGSDEIPLCACGYRGADPDYQHIYRDMHTHGLLVVPAHMFAASVKAVTDLLTVLPADSRIQASETYRYMLGMWKVYVDNFERANSDMDEVDSLDALDYALNEHHCAELMMEEGTVKPAFLCACGQRFVGDWEFEYHRFAEAVSAGAVFGSASDLLEIAATLSFIPTVMSKDVSLPIEVVDSARSATGALVKVVHDAYRRRDFVI